MTAEARCWRLQGGTAGELLQALAAQLVALSGICCACTGAVTPAAEATRSANEGSEAPLEDERLVPLEKPLAGVAVSPGDPVKGRFSLAEATAGVGGEGQLTAAIHTSMGRIDCQLFADRAPLTVANFVGLARGVRPWLSKDGWVRRPFFDGTAFHRVVPGFVIQAGSRPGVLDGGPGFVIPDEVWRGSKHDMPGLLCMANDGPNTGASQFFILAAGPAPQLDGSYTIFGRCLQTEVVEAISRVKAFGEEPAQEVKLKRVVILREASWD